MRVAPQLQKYSESEIVGLIGRGLAYVAGDTVVPMLAGAAPPALDAMLGSSNTSSTTVTTTAGAANDTKVFVCVEWFHATATLTSVSSGALNWTIDRQFLAGSVGVAIASLDVPTGLASSSTIALTYSTAPTAGAISVFSFSGLLTGAGSVDTTSSFNGGLLGSPAAYNSGNLVTTTSTVMICCAGYDKATGVSNTATSPSVEVHELHNATSGETLASEYRIEAIPSTPAAYTVDGQMPGATGTGQLNAVGVAYKAVVTPPVVPPSARGTSTFPRPPLGG